MTHISLHPRRSSVVTSDDFDRLLATLDDVLSRPDNASEADGVAQPLTVDVVMIRKRTGLSQAEFACRIGVPVGTLRNWEQGRRSPQGPARILLALLERNPRIVEDTLGG
jgi:putative transcriptional regulator